MGAGFRGQYWHNLDQKNRIFIPSKFRTALGQHATVCKPLSGEKCLYIYPDDEWEALVARVNESQTGKMRTQVTRLFYLNSDEVEQDGQGRITLNSDYCEFAGFSKEVFVVGVGNRIELWSRENFDAMTTAAEEDGLFNLEDLAY